jgi:hypothetical protein
LKSSGPSSALAGSAWRALFELADYSLFPRLDDDSKAIDERKRISGMMLSLYASITNVLKDLVDLDDVAAVIEVDGRWSQTLNLWSPEDRTPTGFEVDILREQLGDADPMVKDAQRLAEANEALVAAKNQLIGFQKSRRFLLCAWVIHRLVDSDSPRDWSNLLTHFLSHFTNLTQVNEAAGLALRESHQGGDPWSWWIAQEIPEGQTYQSSDAHILIAFALLALLRIDPAQRGRGIEDWVDTIIDHQVELAGLVEQTRDREQKVWRALDPPADLDLRAQSLLQSLTAAGVRRQERKAANIRTSDPNPAKVELFKTSVRSGWQANGLTRFVFERAQRLRTEGPWQANPAEPLFGTSLWLPKEMFLTPSAYAGLDVYASQLGRGIGLAEMDSFVVRLFASDQIRTDSASPDDAVHGALRQFSEEGYQASLMLIAADWRVQQTLGLRHFRPGEEELPAGWTLPPTLRYLYRGVIEGVPVFEWRSIPKPRAYLVDMGALGQWRQWTVNGDLLRITVTAHSAAEAAELVRKQPTLFTNGGASDETRANLVLSNIYVDVRERWVLDIADTRASRWVAVPDVAG